MVVQRPDDVRAPPRGFLQSRMAGHRQALGVIACLARVRDKHSALTESWTHVLGGLLALHIFVCDAVHAANLVGRRDGRRGIWLACGAAFAAHSDRFVIFSRPLKRQLLSFLLGAEAAALSCL